jgi:hypothetical protein
MEGLMTYNNFAKAEGLGLCWTKDTSKYIILLANNLSFAARQSLIVAKSNPEAPPCFVFQLNTSLASVKTIVR